MDTTTIGKIVTANSDIAKVMNGNAVVWSGVEAPGPKTLIGGNLQAGFYGECPTSELITGDELARRIGLTVGTSQFSNEPWLKFSYMGKVEFVAKKPFRYSISWNEIDAINAVFGNKTIKIGDNTYKVRLMKGKTEGKQDDTSEYKGDINKGSEWNKLMLPIHKNAPSNWKYRDNVNSPTENWDVGYTNGDLTTLSRISFGYQSWCQEAFIKFDRKSNLLRGSYKGISYSDQGWSEIYDSSYGWRPVLELVE